MSPTMSQNQSTKLKINTITLFPLRMGETGNLATNLLTITTKLWISQSGTKEVQLLTKLTSSGNFPTVGQVLHHFCKAAVHNGGSPCTLYTCAILFPHLSLVQTLSRRKYSTRKSHLHKTKSFLIYTYIFIIIAEIKETLLLQGYTYSVAMLLFMGVAPKGKAWEHVQNFTPCIQKGSL